MRTGHLQVTPGVGNVVMMAARWRPCPAKMTTLWRPCAGDRVAAGRAIGGRSVVYRLGRPLVHGGKPGDGLNRVFGLPR